MKIWKNKTGMVLLTAMAIIACNQDVKREQTISFEEIPPQILSDSAVRLKAEASSGLPVTFVSADNRIATVEDDLAVFHAAGNTLIYAVQRGNENFNEAPDVSRNLLVRDWDLNKKIQTITFDLPDLWQISVNGQIMPLTATASSGLPVRYTVSGASAGRFIHTATFYVYHAGEGGCDFRDKYVTFLTFTASQDGNEEYNYADNVSGKIRIIGDVLH